MAEARMDIVIGSTMAQRGAEAVKNAVNGIKSSFIDLAAKVFVAERALAQAWNMAKEGARFEETMGRLNRQMGTFHSTAQLMINDLDRVSKGTLGVDKSATMASRALAVGLDPSQIQLFTRAAMLLKDQLNTDLPSAFDRLVDAAVTSRGAILAEIGIFVDMDEIVKRHAVSTGRLTDAIGKKEKAMLMAKAISGQVLDAENRLSDGMVSHSTKLQQMQKNWDNFWTGLQVNSKNGAMAFVDSAVIMLKWIEKLDNKLRSSFSDDLIGKWNELKRSFDHFIDPQGAALAEQFPQDNAKWDAYYEKALAADKKANDARKAADALKKKTDEDSKPLPASMRRAAIQDSADIQTQILRGQEDRMQQFLQAEAEMLDADFQMQKRTAEQVVAAKGELAMLGLQEHLETIEKERAAERISYEAQKKINADSITEDIALEKDHKTKVTESTEAIYNVKHALGIQNRKNEKDNAVAIQESFKTTGDEMVRQYQENLAVMEEVRKKDFDGLQTYYEGWFDMANARYASDQDIAAKERELLREQLAFKLKLTKEEVDRMLFLRRASRLPFDEGSTGAQDILDRGDPLLTDDARHGMLESGAAKDILLAERANDDFFAGWSRGMQNYVKDTKTGFGLAADMARRTAQVMEQGFQQFFFDGMEGKFQSFKDVLEGVLDFTKKIISQIMAQMVMVGVVKAMGGAMAGGTGAADFSKTNFFAHGGVGDFGSGQLAMLHGREAVVPLEGGRSIPVSMKFPSGGASPGSGTSVSVPIDIQVINQVSGAKVETQQQSGPDGRQQIKILIRQEMKAAYADGSMDKDMQRFGSKPQPIGR